MFVPGGQSFSLGDQNFTSDPSDPTTGSATINFTRKVMPMFTFGFHNMIPGKGHHITVPLELGAAYTGPYSAQLNLGGSACVDQAGCMSTSSSDIQQGVTQEQQQLNEPMKHYQLYPIVMTGVAFRF
jgi:hypothetical protein